MARILVDANVLSERTKERPQASVVKWLERYDAQLTVNPIIIGELEYGILQLPSGRRRTRLLDWFAEGVAQVPVLEIDRETARIWARVLADLRRKGRAMPVKDSLIAATAIQHDLMLATRNTSDYRNVDVRLFNPFQP